MAYTKISLKIISIRDFIQGLGKSIKIYGLSEKKKKKK